MFKPFTEYLRETAQTSNDGNLRGPALSAADRIETLETQLREAEDRAERYRVALEQIVGGKIYTSYDGFSQPHEPEQSRIARAALSDGGENG